MMGFCEYGNEPSGIVKEGISRLAKWLLVSEGIHRFSHFTFPFKQDLRISVV
jgi:hypothetical protein